MEKLIVSSPGRVCLFGEHQDYLNLPVIASAISLRIFIDGKKRTDNLVNIDLPDIEANIKFNLNDNIKYSAKAEYFKSGINVMKRNGFSFTGGFDCLVKGNIPIKAGSSSSSALVVAWINFLSRMSDQEAVLPPEKIAELAYEAEVAEFNESGGMMDQFTSAIGSVIYLNPYPNIQIQKLDQELKTFVLGDSETPKDTQQILAGVKQKVINIVKLVQKEFPDFSLQTVNYRKLDIYSSELDPDQMELLKGTVKNRDITIEALRAFQTEPFDHQKFGIMLYVHHEILNNVLKISTPKINSMIEAAMDAGAYGAKINGSGGGGCMFAYAPENPEKVAEAIGKAGGKSYIINSDKGTSEEMKINL